MRSPYGIPSIIHEVVPSLSQFGRLADARSRGHQFWKFRSSQSYDGLFQEEKEAIVADGVAVVSTLDSEGHSTRFLIRLVDQFYGTFIERGVRDHDLSRDPDLGGTGIIDSEGRGSLRVRCLIQGLGREVKGVVLVRDLASQSNSSYYGEETEHHDGKGFQGNLLGCRELIIQQYTISGVLSTFVPKLGRSWYLLIPSIRGVVIVLLRYKKEEPARWTRMRGLSWAVMTFFKNA